MVEEIYTIFGLASLVCWSVEKCCKVENTTASD